ncbi:MAG: Ni/Fe hydrogenase subunit alpha [Deltaproteobacteria bacterium]|nr:Ni/Fe hydrogenase subunit alpha [Deltaproteobacteria bacterium]
MPKTLKIDPVTRIEGHAQVELEIDDAKNVTGSIFKVMDFRGFETFLCGMQVEMMPTVSARICGTCPQAHHLAASKTVDKVFGLTPPPAAILLRQALTMGSMIHSHGVHFFALAGPDLLMGIGSPAAKRNIVGLVEQHKALATKALQLRSLGQRATEIIGGRGTHPVTFVPGGVSTPLTVEKRDALVKIADEALEIGAKLVSVVKPALVKQTGLIQALPLETHYMGTVAAGGALDFYDGDLRLRAPNGTATDFKIDDWSKHIYEEVAPGSYAKNTYAKLDGSPKLVYRVGPLARLNCIDTIDTPLAKAEFEAFRALGGSPCHQTVLFHYARLVELVYAVEKLAAIAKNDAILSPDVKAKNPGSPRNACAHVEAPRGVLIHDYKVDKNAILTDVNLIVATQQNIPAINSTIALAAKKFVDKPDDQLLNAVEFGIRCYDPCLSCATHRVGEMKMEVVIRHNGVPVRTVRR